MTLECTGRRLCDGRHAGRELTLFRRQPLGEPLILQEISSAIVMLLKFMHVFEVYLYGE